jgi:hypothetical protein
MLPFEHLQRSFATADPKVRGDSAVAGAFIVVVAPVSSFFLQ